MRFCKDIIVFGHTKISAITLGGIMMIWSMLAFGPPDSLFAASLAAQDIQAEWGAIMFCNGFLLVVGSLIPWRSGRHIGLALACFVFTALGGHFFKQGLVTPVSVTMPYLGLMALITLMAEVKGKPRDGKRQGMG